MPIFSERSPTQDEHLEVLHAPKSSNQVTFPSDGMAGSPPSFLGCDKDQLWHHIAKVMEEHTKAIKDLRADFHTVLEQLQADVKVGKQKHVFQSPCKYTFLDSKGITKTSSATDAQIVGNRLHHAATDAFIKEHQFSPCQQQVPNSKMTTREAREAIANAEGRKPYWVTKKSNGNAEAKRSYGYADAKKKSRPLFTNVDDMKAHMRASILQPYNVSIYFWDRGICQSIARHWLFEVVTLKMVIANSLWIAVDVDVNGNTLPSEKSRIFHIIDYGFMAFFTLEIIIRFAAFRSKRYCFKDFWFCFDTAMLLLMYVDPLFSLFQQSVMQYDFSLFRLIRLARMLRMAQIAKVLNKWPELNVLQKGIVLGFRSVMTTLILMITIVYVFAVVFRIASMDTSVGNEYFPSILHGMEVLILRSSMSDQSEIVEDLGAVNFFLGLVCLLFFAITSLTLMNMLIGVMCQVVCAVTSVENEAHRVHAMKDRLYWVLQDYRKQSMVAAPTFQSDNPSDDPRVNDMLITEQDFQMLLLNDSVLEVMEDVGVDPIGLVDYIDHIFEGNLQKEDEKEDENCMAFGRLIELICALGGDNNARVKDVVDMRSLVVRRLDRLEDMVRHLVHEHQFSP